MLPEPRARSWCARSTVRGYETIYRLHFALLGNFVQHNTRNLHLKISFVRHRMFTPSSLPILPFGALQTSDVRAQHRGHELKALCVQSLSMCFIAACDLTCAGTPQLLFNKACGSQGAPIRNCPVLCSVMKLLTALTSLRSINNL
ncbi:hypothetical protein MRB53_039826 [Persea americana]|nr:hypothetical protein MRB53_039826 [Persea americana]